MRVDSYTKLVLTVIAVSLFYLCINKRPETVLADSSIPVNGKFIQLSVNEWQNVDQFKEIDFIPGTGNYVLTDRATGTSVQYSTPQATQALKKFLGQ
jgi:hypothetical protein